MTLNYLRCNKKHESIYNKILIIKFSHIYLLCRSKIALHLYIVRGLWLRQIRFSVIQFNRLISIWLDFLFFRIAMNPFLFKSEDHYVVAQCLSIILYILFCKPNISRLHGESYSFFSFARCNSFVWVKSLALSGPNVIW